MSRDDVSVQAVVSNATDEIYATVAFATYSAAPDIELGGPIQRVENQLLDAWSELRDLRARVEGDSYDG